MPSTVTAVAPRTDASESSQQDCGSQLPEGWSRARNRAKSERTMFAVELRVEFAQTADARSLLGWAKMENKVLHLNQRATADKRNSDSCEIMQLRTTSARSRHRV